MQALSEIYRVGGVHLGRTLPPCRHLLHHTPRRRTALISARRCYIFMGVISFWQCAQHTNILPRADGEARGGYCAYMSVIFLDGVAYCFEFSKTRVLGGENRHYEGRECLLSWAGVPLWALSVLVGRPTHKASPRADEQARGGYCVFIGVI